ncbi:ROK family protein [Nocardioides jishulii]|uniref:ROK family protein n=1 Tax=Nocardioides jishulii TaxID=2575440 RepID=A0A4V6X612_9ACTN|nr:ROK family protein [Nocardioides jishulii]QCX27149.1 ROK family protein [Nocardioides jishulii]TKI61633.1 ROK family protein [Nocardioides jishulii]
MTDPFWVGIDVGGTKVLAGRVDAAGRVARVVRLPSGGPSAPVELLEQTLTEALARVCAGATPTGVGVAAAGLVDAVGEVVSFAPHLPWRDADVRTRLSARWGVPVALENDATCAVWAEVEHGALVGVSDALMVALGTGIGGGLVVGGHVVRGAGGMAGEFGHMQVVPDGRPCPCGLTGCWERYCSGSALAMAAGPRFGSGPAITDAARADDEGALAAFDEVGRWLGVGVANLVAAVDPSVVVIGGGVSAADDLLLVPAARALRTHLVAAADRRLPELVVAHHAENAGVVGAAVLARRLTQR